MSYYLRFVIYRHISISPLIVVVFTIAVDLFNRIRVVVWLALVLGIGRGVTRPPFKRRQPFPLSHLLFCPHLPSPLLSPPLSSSHSLSLPPVPSPFPFPVPPPLRSRRLKFS